MANVNCATSGNAQEQPEWDVLLNKVYATQEMAEMLHKALSAPLKEFPELAVAAKQATHENPSLSTRLRSIMDRIAESQARTQNLLDACMAEIAIVCGQIAGS